MFGPAGRSPAWSERRFVMWAELLPKLVGGTIVDRDSMCGDSPAATITGFELRDDWVEIQTDGGWSFGANRKYIGVSSRDVVSGSLVLSTPFGSQALVTFPAEPR